MSGVSYFIHYAEANLVCVIIFCILLIHDLLSVDRQEKQIKFDNALITFILYYISDSIWAGIIGGVIPRTRFSVVVVNLANYFILFAMTYSWLVYVLSVEQVPNRERRSSRLALLFPFFISTAALFIVCFAAPQVLLNESLEIQPAYTVFLILVPYIYIAAVIIYTISRAVKEENPLEKKKHLYISFIPIIVVVGGFLQLTIPRIPIFCFSCTVLMLMFYIQSMETRISMDPLTRLNNRGQLIHYISQRSNLYRENSLTFVVMIDVNDFKSVNDTYGHAEGDRALTIVADSLKAVMRGHSMPAFLGRYGGDEFVMIIHPTDASELEAMKEEIRLKLAEDCRIHGTPYQVSVGIGYDKLGDEGDSIHECMKRADQKLYIDKEQVKKSVRKNGV